MTSDARPAASFSVLIASLLRRLKVCVLWLLGSLSPKTSRRAMLSSAGQLIGQSLQTLGFVAIAKLILHIAASPDPLLSKFIQPDDQSGAFITCALFALIIIGAGAISYRSLREGIRIATDFETERFVEAVTMVREAKEKGLNLSQAVENEIQLLAPRYMGRMLMQLLNAIPAMFIASVALAFSLWLNLSLTMTVIAILVIFTPLFMRFLLYSSQTSRRMKEAATGFSRSKRALTKEFAAEPDGGHDAMHERIAAEPDYQTFIDAYRARMTIAPSVQFLAAISLSAILMGLFLWVLYYQQHAGQSLSDIVVSVILMRVIIQGVNQTFAAVTMMGLFYPFFEHFITLAAGQVPVSASESGALEDEVEFV